MNYAGNPANDIILVRDEMHRTMMERGSKRLRDAICIYQQGWRPKASIDDVMWLMPFEPGKRVRPVSPSPIAAFEHRDPCGRCGVRADRHRVHGCASYRRGRVE